MRALVTGSAGFIGSEIVRTLEAAGHEVTGIDIAEGGIGGGIDVRSLPGDDGWVSEYHWDAVIHCAAKVGGRRVIEWTPLDHAGNLAIDAALFQWAHRTRPGRVVYFSSSCAYPIHLAHQKRRLYEDDIRWPPAAAMWPDELYGWTKLTGELVARTASAAGVPVSIVRPFSVYGPGVRDGFAIRGFTEQIRRRADPIEVWGSAEQVRDFIHVADVAAAVLAIIRGEIDGPVNLGTGRGTSLRQLAAMMAAAAGYEPEIKVDPGMPAGTPQLVADASLLRSFCPPKVRLEDYFAEVLG